VASIASSRESAVVTPEAKACVCEAQLIGDVVEAASEESRVDDSKLVDPDM